MRASELVDQAVVDADGRSVGRVVDVRLVLDGPLGTGVLAAPRVHAIIVGRGGAFNRLGYDRAAMRGPWLIRTIVHRLHRHQRLVRWDQIAAVEHGCVRLTVRRDELVEIGGR